MVIGIVLFVVLVVAGVYFAMMATINKIEKEGTLPASQTETYVTDHAVAFTFR